MRMVSVAYRLAIDDGGGGSGAAVRVVVADADVAAGVEVGEDREGGRELVTLHDRSGCIERATMAHYANMTQVLGFARARKVTI